jgi:hypothetical protein
MSPPRLPPGDRRHLLPGHLPHGRTVAGAGVPHCAGTVMGDGCGRAALCAHGRAMPVTRLRVLRQMPHPVPAVCAVLMRGAAVRAPRSGRELVGRAGGIAAARAVACRARCWWRFQVQGTSSRADGSRPPRPRSARLQYEVGRSANRLVGDWYFRTRAGASSHGACTSRLPVISCVTRVS